MKNYFSQDLPVRCGVTVGTYPGLSLRSQCGQSGWNGNDTRGGELRGHTVLLGKNAEPKAWFAIYNFTHHFIGQLAESAWPYVKLLGFHYGNIYVQYTIS